jgi:hypothetical protein
MLAAAQGSAGRLKTGVPAMLVGALAGDNGSTAEDISAWKRYLGDLCR